MMQALVLLLVAMSLSQGVPAVTTGRIAGSVTVEGANTPVAGARVSLIPAGRPSGPIGMPPQMTTDQQGRFAFDQLAPGAYRLDVQKTGFVPLLGSGTRLSTIQVTAGQTLDGVHVQLQKGGVIAGKVLEPSGEPLTDARIMALRRIDGPGGAAAPRLMPAPMQGSLQPNDLGEFRISGLAPGEYYVAARPGGTLAFGGPSATPQPAGTTRTALTTTFYPGTIDQAGAQPVTVAAGAEVGNIVFTVQSAPVFRVSGLVVDEDGTPVARAMVMLMGDPRSGMFMGPGGSTQTQDDGRFVIGDVSSGSYRITATVPITVSTAGTSGGITGGTFTTFNSNGRTQPPPEVVVADADVGGVRVVVRSPPR